MTYKCNIFLIKLVKLLANECPGGMREAEELLYTSPKSALGLHWEDDVSIHDWKYVVVTINDEDRAMMFKLKYGEVIYYEPQV